MDASHLIQQLTADVRPVPRNIRARRLGVGILVGGLVTLALVAFGLGLRPDLAVAMHGFAFWMKFAFTVSLGLAAGAMTARLARPEPVRLTRFWPITLPFVVLAIVGAVEMARAPAQDWLAMWLGDTWKICPWLVLALSIPIFVCLIVAFRRFAPTRLRAAGAAAGLTAGAWAGALYCLHCPEVSAIFVLTWYSLGILLSAGGGALLGPQVLRW